MAVQWSFASTCTVDVIAGSSPVRPRTMFGGDLASTGVKTRGMHAEHR